MKAFLWKQISEVTTRYHPEGGVLIQAPTLERAREIALKEDWDARHVDEDDPVSQRMQGIDAEPDAIFDSDSTEEKVWIFPDAGCC